jgi:hypothetical protein
MRMGRLGVGVIGATLLALGAMGPGCSPIEDDFDGRTDEVATGGASGSGGSFSVGGSGGDLILDGECEMGCGGSAGHLIGFGGLGGLGGAGNCGDACTEAVELGSFARGRALPSLRSDEVLLPGERSVWAITFSEVVWFEGTLASSGAGEPTLYVLSADGTIVTYLSGSWKNYVLPAGDYYLIIAAGSASLDQGYSLEMSTAPCFRAGTVTNLSSVSTSGVLEEIGDVMLFDFVAQVPTVLSGNVEVSSGRVYVTVLDNSGIVLTHYGYTDSPLPAVGPLEVPPGTYVIQLVTDQDDTEFTTSFEWDDP